MFPRMIFNCPFVLFLTLGVGPVERGRVERGRVEWPGRFSSKSFLRGLV